jgi:hypothetical protein
VPQAVLDQEFLHLGSPQVKLPLAVSQQKMQFQHWHHIQTLPQNYNA